MDSETIDVDELWRPKIFHALATCDAAIVLLDPRAKTRPWVLSEVWMLRMRKLMDPKFLVQIVEFSDANANLDSIDDGAQRAFAELFKVVAELEYQKMMIDDQDIVDEVVNKIFDWFQQQDPKTIVHPWIHGMQQTLNATFADEGRLGHFARGLIGDRKDLGKRELISIRDINKDDRNTELNLDDLRWLQGNDPQLAIAAHLFGLAPHDNSRLIGALVEPAKNALQAGNLEQKLRPMWVSPLWVEILASKLQPGFTGTGRVLIFHIPSGNTDVCDESTMFTIAKHAIMRYIANFISRDDFRVHYGNFATPGTAAIPDSRNEMNRAKRNISRNHCTIYVHPQRVNDGKPDELLRLVLEEARLNIVIVSREPLDVNDESFTGRDVSFFVIDARIFNEYDSTYDCLNQHFS